VSTQTSRDFKSTRLSVLNFLNEVAMDHPRAVSFASGRPAEHCFDFDGWLDAIPQFQRHFAEQQGLTRCAAGRLLSQYGRTNGLINDLVAAQLAADEGINSSPERIVMTAGCQEALALCLQTLCTEPDDVVVARNPTYVGVTGAADMARIQIFPVAGTVDDACAAMLDRTADELAAQGKRVRAFYVIPEFDNPTGAALSTAERLDLLAVCAKHGIVVLEDNPYGMFRFEGETRLPLAALDVHGCVIYLGTYSKTLCPSLRVGCAVIPETLFGDAAESRNFVRRVAERKSFVTTNTSQFNQALVGGVLLAQQCSLRRIVQPALEHYRRNRDALVGCLNDAFADERERITWNHPQGGFFLSMQLPFEFCRSEVVECAREYEVIPMPMSFFALDGSQRTRVRFAFSNIMPDAIEQGVERFALFVDKHLS
jgi:(S)-3,5-dihydroxyphenylglycine transaminase